MKTYLNFTFEKLLEKDLELGSFLDRIEAIVKDIRKVRQKELDYKINWVRISDKEGEVRTPGFKTFQLEAEQR